MSEFSIFVAGLVMGTAIGTLGTLLYAVLHDWPADQRGGKR